MKDIFRGYLLCTDLDGTLLARDGSISRENRAAIAHFQAGGGLFTFITGRMPFFVADIIQAAQPNAPIGCINGGGIYDPKSNRYLWQCELPRTALTLAAYAEAQLPTVGVQVNMFDKIFFCRENKVMAAFRQTTGAPFLPATYASIREPMAKIVFGVAEEEEMRHLQELLQAHPLAKDFDFIRSEQTLFEILPKGVSKGAVLLKMAELLSIEQRHVMAVGDYDNDVSMLRVAGTGYAVANACPAAKAAADRITVSHEQHAVAAIVATLEKELAG